MADRTMGKRIAEERKKLGLSQEGLGEKVGVSRQSISKWESDGATPEIEKLIALSKLFGVSVGWLLGVEEKPEKQENELSEVQLKVVGQLVKQAQPASHNEWRTVFAMALTVAVLLVTFVTAKQMHDTALQARGSENQIAALSEQLEDIHGRLAVMESAVLNPGEQLLAEYAFEVTPKGYLPEYWESVALVSFTAVPKVWNNGDTGYLSFRGGNGHNARVDCIWDGTRLRAAETLKVHPAYDKYEICFIVEHAGGSQEQQVLQSETIDQLAQHFTIPIAVDMGSLEYEDNVLILKDFTARFSLPSIFDSAENVPSVLACEYLLQGLPLEDSTYIHFPADMLEHSRLDLDGDYLYVISGTDIRFEDVVIEDYDHMHLKFHVKLSNGMERYFSITTIE